jgi:ATP-dependent Clp protease adapter protein ClpS
MESVTETKPRQTTVLVDEAATPATLPEAEVSDEEKESPTEPGEGWRVVLYNDEDHYREEVIVQVMVATNCDERVASAIVDRAHQNGQATVTITDRDDAERVAGVLRKINLQVAVEHVA